MLIHLKEAPKTPVLLTSGAAALFLPAVFFVVLGVEDAISQQLFEFFTSHDTLTLQAVQTSTDTVAWFMSSHVEDIKIFSEVLYTYHASLFFLAALLLLTAMLGAIILATQATDSENALLHHLVIHYCVQSRFYFLQNFYAIWSL